MRLSNYSALVLSCTLAWTSTASGQTWKPERNVEIIVPSGPGGGTDRTGRTVQSLLESGKLLDKSSVINKPGAGGGLGLVYLNGHSGDAHYVSVSQVPLLTNHITGVSKLTYSDVTPLAQLYSEYVVFAVRADSPIRSGKDLIDRLRNDPQSVSIGVTSLGGTSHMAAGLVVRKAGGDGRRLKIVVFKGGGDVTTALLGGHVDLSPAPVGNLLPQIKAGRLRAIAITAPQRMPRDLAQIPTWREQGTDAVFDTWRGMIGPPGMTAAQLAFWDSTLSRLTQREEWQKDLAQNCWGDNYLRSDSARKYLAQEYQEFKALLTDLGLAK